MRVCGIIVITSKNTILVRKCVGLSATRRAQRDLSSVWHQATRVWPIFHMGSAHQDLVSTFLFLVDLAHRGHLAPMVAHSTCSRQIFGIAHTVWDAGVRISTALDIRRGSGPTAHSIACLREGSIIQRFMIFYIVRLASAVPHGPRHSARFRRCMGWLRNRIRRRGGQTVPGRGGGGGGVKTGYGQAGQGYFGYTL